MEITLICILILIFLLPIIFPKKQRDKFYAKIFKKQCEKSLKKIFEIGGPEAIKWIKDNLNTKVGSGNTRDESLLFLEKLYSAGAIEVQVSQIVCGNTALAVIIICPEDENKKAALMDICKDYPIEAQDNKMFVFLD